MEKNKSSTCRICLQIVIKSPEKCLSLFETHNATKVVDKIQYIVNIKINEGDGLPDKICLNCLLQLDAAVHFKVLCENSDKILNSERDVKLMKCEGDLETFEQTGDILKTEYIEDDLKLNPIEDSYQNQNLTDVEDNSFCGYDSNFDPAPIGSIKVEVKPKPSPKKVDLKLICDDCGETFKSKCKMAVHWKKTHLLDRLICALCKRTFKSYKALHVHAKKQSRNCKIATMVNIEGIGNSRRFYCKECDYSTKRVKDMDSHVATHTGDRRYECSDCFKRFTQLASLHNHKESYHQKYRTDLTCHICGKLLSGRAKLYKHLRRHRPKQVQCDICKKMFKCRNNLIVHIKRHTNIKNFYCMDCPSTFYTSGELQNHHRSVHLKTRDYECDLCTYRLHNSYQLRIHRAKHSETNAACPECGMFVQKDKLEAHRRRHIENNISCPYCGRSYFSRVSINRHIRSKHGEMLPLIPKKNKDNVDQDNNCNKNITYHKMDNDNCNKKNIDSKLAQDISNKNLADDKIELDKNFYIRVLSPNSLQ